MSPEERSPILRRTDRQDTVSAAAARPKGRQEPRRLRREGQQTKQEEALQANPALGFRHRTASNFGQAPEDSRVPSRRQ